MSPDRPVCYEFEFGRCPRNCGLYHKYYYCCNYQNKITCPLGNRCHNLHLGYQEQSAYEYGKIITVTIKNELDRSLQIRGVCTQHDALSGFRLLLLKQPSEDKILEAICVVCTNVLKLKGATYFIACRHTFCNTCVQILLEQTENPVCPICRNNKLISYVTPYDEYKKN